MNSHFHSHSLQANNEEDDDVEINPVTMLLLDQNDGESNKPPVTVTENPLQMQSYFIRSINSTVLIRSLPSQGISFQLWPAATTLVNLLDRHILNPASSPLSGCNLGDNSRTLRILELGSGTGVVGIAAAAILGANVTITDLSHVLPNLQFNADANSDVLAVNGGKVNVAPLAWGEVNDMEDVGREYDLIVGSDVVYHDHLYEPLMETLKFLILGGESANKEKKEVVFVMGHLKRWKKESTFFKMARKYFEVQVIHSDEPVDGCRVGVVVYRFVRKDAVFR